MPCTPDPLVAQLAGQRLAATHTTLTTPYRPVEVSIPTMKSKDVRSWSRD
jgi:hypothetical protein